MRKVFALEKFELKKIIDPFETELGGQLTGEGKINIIDLLRSPDASIGVIISALLPFIYLIAGLILFGAIIVSGFQMMTSGDDQKKTAEAKGCLTSAIIGFVIIFVSWWLIQIIQIIFGLPSLLALDCVFC